MVPLPIQNVSLVVDPPAVQRGQHAILHCLYDLKEPLYSVKFYRGSGEFYRYSPSQEPNQKVFVFPGINVDVSFLFFSSDKVRSFKYFLFSWLLSFNLSYCCNF